MDQRRISSSKNNRERHYRRFVRWSSTSKITRYVLIFSLQNILFHIKYKKIIFHLEKLTGRKLDVPEVTQSEEGQRQKLAVVLNTANRVLGCYPPYKWSVESIHSRNVLSILHLLVSLARLFRAPIRLPELASVQVVIVKKKDGVLTHKIIKEEITSTYDDLGMRCERDAFDALFDYAPEKLVVVKKVKKKKSHKITFIKS